MEREFMRLFWDMVKDYDQARDTMPYAVEYYKGKISGLYNVLCFIPEISNDFFRLVSTTAYTVTVLHLRGE